MMKAAIPITGDVMPPPVDDIASTPPAKSG
jgi:hypothetical protein